MFIECLIPSNFRCFGPETPPIDLSPALTAFVGSNGSGKTAVMQALQRLFGVTGEQRRVRRQDFHIPASEKEPAQQRIFTIEAIIAFPELDQLDGDDSVIPEFFHQMAADAAGRLKCRLRLQATWTNDGSLDGVIEQKFWAVRTFGDFEETDCIEIKAVDRARIQMIYVPATRDAASQVTAFLRGRLWRAINWSAEVRTVFAEVGVTLNDAFGSEAAVDRVTEAVERRWQEVHSAGTDTTPIFRPLDLRFEEFIRKVEVVFYPDEAGRERGLDELSDGQRSLFHLAMTAATLDVEAGIAAEPTAAGFLADGVPLPALTLIAVEEPENNLAPFYLSRIIRQIEDLTSGMRAQAVVASHSASILARVDPTQVRHFRLDPADRTAKVRSIHLPENEEDASKFVREAVRTYPELYFARFVVLGEGASEEVVLPRIAEALDLAVDRSFVAVVPLGGRHVNHLWRLLTDLDIPYATLLDLDWGRAGGGWGRIKTACTQLLANGLAPQALFGAHLNTSGPAAHLAAFDARPQEDTANLDAWAKGLRQFGVFFCVPLDLDYSMLRAFPAAYQMVEPGRQGPSDRGEPHTAVLGIEGLPALYGPSHDQILRWYRYLFLGRGKPRTHVQVLSQLTSKDLATGAPEELQALLAFIVERLDPSRPSGA
jgi:putative ATP-dependent endonuclease of OLD family